MVLLSRRLYFRVLVTTMIILTLTVYFVIIPKSSFIYLSGHLENSNSLDEAEDMIFEQNSYDSFMDFSTYFGGSGEEGRTSFSGWGLELATDSVGNIIVVGQTESSNFPTVNAFQQERNGGKDVTITKFSPFGQTILFSTYFGGTLDEEICEIVIDNEDNIIILGSTLSPDFYTLNALHPSKMGLYLDMFLAKFHSNGSLLFSTYYGGSENDGGNGIDCDDEGNILLSGATYSSGLNTTNAYQTINQELDAYIAVLTPDGQSHLLGSYIGGSSLDGGGKAKFTPDGHIFLIGYTNSTDFPTVNSFQPNNSGLTECYFLKIALNGTLLFSSYLGGSGYDYPEDIVIDSNGNVIIVGGTDASNFPISNAYQPIKKDSVDGFITKVTSSGQILFSTFFGGDSADQCISVDIDVNDEFVITGFTFSDNFPLINAFKKENNGYSDAFISKFTADGQMLNFSSYLGGSNHDASFDVTIDGNSIILAGLTESSDFPTVYPYQDSKAGGVDIFLCKFDPSRITTITTDTFDFDTNSMLLITTSFLIVMIFFVTRKRRDN